MPATVKDRILDALGQLPETATIEDAMERLNFLRKVEQGEREIAEGPIVTHGEVKARFGR